MRCVLKIKFGDTLHRVNFPQNSDVTFSKLQAKIRDLFRIPPTSQIAITYVDDDNDMVTVLGDDDLQDALVIQNLNPLRLDVKVIDAIHVEQVEQVQASLKHQVEKAHALIFQVPEPKSVTEAVLTRFLANLSSKAFNQLLTAYEPLFKAAVPCAAALEAVEGIVKSFAEKTVPAASFEAALSTELLKFLPVDSLREPSWVDTKQTAETQFSDTALCISKISANKKETFEPETSCRILHKGVQCDQCGIEPIVGPRFKSIKKDDYDLCFSCFTEIGNDTDYRRFDRPIHSCKMRHHHLDALPLGGPFGWRSEFQPHSSTATSVNIAGKCSYGKLDAQFVQDVTVFDGTQLAPSTQFTKIWRMRNIGNLPWPQHTQLVYVDGDILGSHLPVVIKLPEEGLQLDEELDVSVDLVAPEWSGQYASHWQLMAPSGQRFGHRVWVLIQVVLNDDRLLQVKELLPPNQEAAAVKEIHFDDSTMTDEVRDVACNIVVPTEGISQGSILSELPVEGSVSSEVQSENSNDGSSVTVNGEVGGFSIVEMPLEDPFSELLQSEQSIDLFEPVATITEFSDQTTAIKEEQNAEIEQSFGLQSLQKFPSTLEATSSVGRDVCMDDSSKVVAPEEQPLVELKSETVQYVDNDVEAIVIEALLEHLDSIGFTQTSLNLELLQKNKNNVQNTIQDLVTAAEWEPTLNELQDMGFSDKEMNLRLMFKNNGSLKRVVKELVLMQIAGGKVTSVVKGNWRSWLS